MNIDLKEYSFYIIRNILKNVASNKKYNKKKHIEEK